jgi:drug/metabolite transporter (DMT)-like permease
LLLYAGREMFQTNWLSLPGEAWASLLYAAYPVTAYALAAWNYGMEAIGPNRVMPYMYFVPVAAIVVAVGWIGETLSVSQALGGGCILLGVLIVRKPKRMKPTIDTLKQNS